MTDDNAAGISVPVSLKPRAIEKVFTECVMDIKRILVLDGIDILPNGFRVRSHDLHGQLPEIFVENSGDTFQDKEKLGTETCKLLAIVKLRKQIVTWLPGSKFLPPSSFDGRAIVGLQAKPKTWIVEGDNFFDAYHKLHSQIVG